MDSSILNAKVLYKKIQMKKSNFIKIYSSLPDGIRREVIVVIDNKPYTWDAAYIEINTDTDLGKRILEKLVNMGLIENGK